MSPKGGTVLRTFPPSGELFSEHPPRGGIILDAFPLNGGTTLSAFARHCLQEKKLFKNVSPTKGSSLEQGAGYCKNRPRRREIFKERVPPGLFIFKTFPPEGEGYLKNISPQQYRELS